MMKNICNTGSIVRLSTNFRGDLIGKILEISDDKVIVKISDMDVPQHISRKLFDTMLSEILDIDEVQFKLMY